MAGNGGRKVDRSEAKVGVHIIIARFYKQLSAVAGGAVRVRETGATLFIGPARFQSAAGVGARFACAERFTRRAVRAPRPCARNLKFKRKARKTNSTLVLTLTGDENERPADHLRAFILFKIFFFAAVHLSAGRR